MRQIYTVHVGGKSRYHGINQSDALETILAATSAGERDIQLQRTPWPQSAPITYGLLPEECL